MQLQVGALCEKDRGQTACHLSFNSISSDLSVEKWPKYKCVEARATPVEEEERRGIHRGS